MQTFCAGCGKPIVDREINYTADARPVCDRCNSVADLVQSNRNVANNIRAAALSAMATGVISWIFDPFLVLTIMSAASALYALTSFGRGEERFTMHLASEKGLIIGAAVFALLLDFVKLASVYSALS